MEYPNKEIKSKTFLTKEQKSQPKRGLREVGVGLQGLGFGEMGESG